MGARMWLSVKTRPCGRSLASGLRGAQDLKLLLRVKEPALSTVFWLEKTVAGGITTTRQFCPRNLSGEEKLLGRLVCQRASYWVDWLESCSQPKLPEVLDEGGGS